MTNKIYLDIEPDPESTDDLSSAEFLLNEAKHYVVATAERIPLGDADIAVTIERRLQGHTDPAHSEFSWKIGLKLDDTWLLQPEHKGAYDGLSVANMDKVRGDLLEDVMNSDKYDELICDVWSLHQPCSKRILSSNTKP